MVVGKRKMKKISQPSGMSLIEVMIVVVIIAIAAALTFPMMVNYTERNRLKQSAEDFYNDVVRARTEALKTKSTVIMSLQTGSGWCYGLTTDSGGCNCNVTGNCSLGEIQSSKYQGSVTALSATGIVSSLQFEGDRGVATPTGSVNFTSSSGDVISVEINEMGAPVVCSSDIGGYDPC